MDLKEARQLGGDAQERHWYYASKSRALLRCLDDRPPRMVLDVGAGTGFFSRAILRNTPASGAICVDTGYANDWVETDSGKSIAFRRHATAADADLVLLMDVLEHVENDVDLLGEYARAAREGTRFVVSVPAFSWLWSAHDDFLGHRRRYSLTGVRRVASNAGLTPIRGFYFFAAVFPAVAVQRMFRRFLSPDRESASDLRRHHPWTNALLTTICQVESGLARHNRAFGLTAFVVAEKR